MAKTDSLINDMKKVISSKMDTNTAFVEVDSKSFGLKIGKRKKSFLKENEPIVTGAVKAILDDGLEAVGDISLSVRNL
jgi:hypothetical protein